MTAMENVFQYSQNPKAHTVTEMCLKCVTGQTLIVHYNVDVQQHAPCVLFSATVRFLFDLLMKKL